MFKFEGDGDFECEIVGESFYQDALEEIAGPKTDEAVELVVEAVLTPEPNNPHDSNAVGVYIDGKKVGHLARALAARWVQLLDKHDMAGQPVLCDAMIVGGWSRDGGQNVGSYGVRLDI